MGVDENGEGVSARQHVPLDASVANTADSEGAADALARVIEKGGFAGTAREVVGVFNLGLLSSGSGWWYTIGGIGSILSTDS